MNSQIYKQFIKQNPIYRSKVIEDVLADNDEDFDIKDQNGKIINEWYFRSLNDIQDIEQYKLADFLHMSEAIESFYEQEELPNFLSYLENKLDEYEQTDLWVHKKAEIVSKNIQKIQMYKINIISSSIGDVFLDTISVLKISNQNI